ncbi:metallophosphoesterase family protein [Fulvivirga lutea]|uniref:Phosphoesterase n=1 Tax=Fulvivirga lutea TaxID=2810512 RepID=A0A974WEC0_9BACT|nr:metallophosphoesterase family protein [Fulvivirga lutea]QSE96019.1 metallophosphoesterase family protein [Fulvivirga lutea]
MKIGLLSDTHGHLDDRVFHHFKECDEIWHAGDIGTIEVLEKLEAFKPTRAVFGNIDGQKIRSATSEDLWFNCDGLTVWITHIGGYPPKYNRRTKEILKTKSPDLFICGHSHILKVIKDPNHNLLHMNPGAAGIQGFHKVKTLMRFDIEQKEIKNLQVIELGKRA